MIRNKPSRRGKGAVVAPRRKVIDMERREVELKSGLPEEIFKILVEEGLMRKSQLQSFLRRWGSHSIFLGKDPKFKLPISLVRSGNILKVEPTRAADCSLREFCLRCNDLSFKLLPISLILMKLSHTSR